MATVCRGGRVYFRESVQAFDDFSRFLFVFEFAGEFVQPTGFVPKIFAGVFVKGNGAQNLGNIEQKIVENQKR